MLKLDYYVDNLSIINLMFDCHQGFPVRILELEELHTPPVSRIDPYDPHKTLGFFRFTLCFF
jgi:hypothetical protein